MSFTFKKFFNTDAPVDASTPTASLASLMATQGSSISSGFSASLPNVNTESNGTPPTATEVPPVEPTSETPPAAPATSEESLNVSEETTPTQTTATIEPEREEVKIPSWQEVLKSQQPDAIMRELGFNDEQLSFFNEFRDLDPKMVNFLKHWKNNGEVETYLRELSTDYSKMPAEDVMRHQLRQDYPKASQQQLNLLYQTKVIQQYNLDSDDESERENGKLLMEAEADKHRDVLASRQQDYLLPKAPEPKAAQQTADPMEAFIAQEVEATKQRLINDPYIKSLPTNKAISFGEGDEKFNFQIDPNRVMELLLNSEKWSENLFIEEKQPNGMSKFIPKAREQALLAAISINPFKFLSDFAEHYKGIGRKLLNDKIENASQPSSNTPAKAEAQPQSAAAAMAKSGVILNGGRR